jgi:hypothetical protein
MNAAADGNAACLQLLLGGGADWALRSKADQSALGLAEDVKSYDSELKKWGKAELLYDPLLALAEANAAGRLMREARTDGLADAALGPGTRVRVAPHGEGSYERSFGANSTASTSTAVAFRRSS